MKTAVSPLRSLELTVALAIFLFLAGSARATASNDFAQSAMNANGIAESASKQLQKQMAATGNSLKKNNDELNQKKAQLRQNPSAGLSAEIEAKQKTVDELSKQLIDFTSQQKKMSEAASANQAAAKTAQTSDGESSQGLGAAMAAGSSKKDDKKSNKKDDSSSAGATPTPTPTPTSSSEDQFADLTKIPDDADKPLQSKKSEKSTTHSAVASLTADGSKTSLGPDFEAEVLAASKALVDQASRKINFTSKIDAASASTASATATSSVPTNKKAQSKLLTAAATNSDSNSVALPKPLRGVMSGRSKKILGSTPSSLNLSAAQNVPMSAPSRASLVPGEAIISSPAPVSSSHRKN